MVILTKKLFSSVKIRLDGHLCVPTSCAHVEALMIFFTDFLKYHGFAIAEENENGHSDFSHADSQD